MFENERQFRQEYVSTTVNDKRDINLRVRDMKTSRTWSDKQALATDDSNVVESGETRSRRKKREKGRKERVDNDLTAQ